MDINKPNQKIGILGGTFNPIHNGHLLLAQTAREAFSLDSVLVMPSGQSYLKANKQVLEGHIRYEMVKLAVSDMPYLIPCDMEIKRPGNTYTYETLYALKDIYPDTVFYFIIGADNLFSIENWVKPKEIFANCVLLVAVRNDIDKESLLEKAEELKSRFSADIRLLPFQNTPISSTQIRECVKKGEAIGSYVPERVASYICEHHLYQNLT